MFTAFLLTWLGVIAAQAAPGPNLLAVASMALSQGRRPARFVVAGIASGMLVWSLATSLGFGLLIDRFPAALSFLKLAGGAYLVWLGIKAARSTLRAGERSVLATSVDRPSHRAAWRRGLLVVLTNPKAMLMWAAVASFLFGQGLDTMQVLAFGPLGALSGLVVYGSYAWLFSTGAAMQGYSRFARAFEAVFATAFGAMGASLLWSGVREAQR